MNGNLFFCPLSQSEAMLREGGGGFCDEVSRVPCAGFYTKFVGHKIIVKKWAVYVYLALGMTLVCFVP